MVFHSQFFYPPEDFYMTSVNAVEYADRDNRIYSFKRMYVLIDFQLKMRFFRNLQI